MKPETVKLRTIKCPNCGERKTILLDELIGVCPNCRHKMIEDPNIYYKEKSNILNEAYQTINGDRQDQYGKPEDSFKIIASFWITYLENKYEIIVDLDSLDIAHMMTLFKIARMLGQKPNRDNYRDAIGYLAIAADR